MILNKTFYKMMRDRLRSQGWDSVTHFCRGARIPYTRETASRVFDPHPTRHLSNDTLLIVLKYLNYTKSEIRDILKNYTDDKELWPMIDHNEIELTKEEEVFLSIVKELPGEQLSLLADHLILLGKSIGKDYTKQLGILKRNGKE